MGRPQVRLHTESGTDRRFTTIRERRNGKTSYHKVYLRTTDEEVARRRLIALDGVDDHEEARRRIGRLASASSEAHERAILADFVHPPMFRQSVTIEDAREELSGILDGFMDIEDVTEEVLERWRHASLARQGNSVGMLRVRLECDPREGGGGGGYVVDQFEELEALSLLLVSVSSELMVGHETGRLQRTGRAWNKHGCADFQAGLDL